MLTVIAQVDSVSGGAGWAGAGLLGAVLAWLLLRHLPSKDVQLKEMVESRDVLAKDLAVVTAAALKDARNEFKESLQSVVEHCKDDTQSARLEFKTTLQLIVDHCQKEIEAVSRGRP